MKVQLRACNGIHSYSLGIIDPSNLKGDYKMIILACWDDFVMAQPDSDFLNYLLNTYPEIKNLGEGLDDVIHLK